MRLLRFWVYCGCYVFILSWGRAAANPVVEPQPLPEIACRYQLTVKQRGKPEQSHIWLFWRSRDQVQTQTADGEFGELWRLSPSGHIFYQKLYHADKTVLEYMPADQAAGQFNFSWLKLVNMLDQNELNQLPVIKKTIALKRPAEMRAGKLARAKLQVTWLINEQVPAKIIRAGQGLSMELRLLAISNFADSAVKPVSAAELQNYRYIDAADLGDMENDAFVKKIHLH